ncbi:response regulator transcription factor [Ornithinimicrobium sp. F0845]|uniref:response regulator transcription factor n=1 Tax=Ornithinimicrobium sp. F0845 TaxID=2926412 RepID=UPI001FF2AC31|nr:response regulator transcription factor [Ornithinimicrobium sp. F0845]MCK0112952.1 response regulator transcription factor [Ornithinimicrobium sp. F0845]
MANILIAEDEERIALFVAKGLRAAGYQTHVVADGVSALEHASSGDYDLLVLDVGMPKMDGFTVLRVLRTLEHDIPIIMVTARDAVTDTVAGLEGGADDYLTKPFKFEELLARVRTRLRPRPGAPESTVLSHGDLALDLTTRVATVGDTPVELSPREFAMAREFLEHPGQVLSREQLLSRVWGYDFDGASNVVDVYIRYLRNKLGAERFDTVRGVGYRLTEG